MGVVGTPRYTAVIGKSAEWWIGWVEQVPGVNCQERTKEELLETLSITLNEILDDAASREASYLDEGYERQPLLL